MTRDEFINRFEQEFRSILFAGFFFDERDPAMRYRKMQAEANRLREKLGQMHHDLYPPPKLPNGKPPVQQQPQVKK